MYWYTDRKDGVEKQVQSASGCHSAIHHLNPRP
jgi:hypothetical protein